MTVLPQRRGVEETSKAAQAAENLRTTSGGHVGLHEIDGTLTGLDVDAGTGVRGLVAHCFSSLGSVWVASATTSRADAGTCTG